MLKKKRTFLIAAAAAALLLAAFAFYYAKGREPHSATAFAMGSYVQQTLYGYGAQQAGQDAYQAITGLENRISWRRGHSAVDLLNQGAGGGPVAVDPDTRAILETALSVSEKSGGAFDVTVAPLSRLWDFDTDPHLPDGESVAQALSFVDYRRLGLSDEGVSLPRGMAVDLGAAGKGAACDAAVEIYKKDGVKGAVVAVGGSVGLYGQKPGGGPWQVSVRDPWGEGSIGVLALEGGFVSTSGSYEKFFEEGGRVYHHLLDPKTGYPAESGLVSVTVCSDNGALSDCLATACFVLGYEESLALLEGFGAQAVFVDEGGKITCTEGLQGCFTPGP